MNCYILLVNKINLCLKKDLSKLFSKKFDEVRGLLCESVKCLCKGDYKYIKDVNIVCKCYKVDKIKNNVATFNVKIEGCSDIEKKIYDDMIKIKNEVFRCNVDLNKLKKITVNITVKRKPI